LEFEYGSVKVERLFKDLNKMKRKIGDKLTKAVKKRCDQLKAAETFADFLSLRLGKPHSLSEDKKGCYGIYVTGNIRLVVAPISEDLSPESLKVCRKIIVKGVEDYHGSKTRTFIP